MPDPARVCPACGARNAPDAVACDLCGHDFDDALDFADDTSALDPSTDPAASDAGPGSAVSGSTGDGAGEAGSTVFCTSCGTRNPGGSRFCAQCGMRLVMPVAASPAVAPAIRVAPVAAPAVDAVPVAPEAGRRIAILAVGALLLVAGLYLATAASKRQGDKAPSFQTPEEMSAGAVSQTPAAGAAPAAAPAAAPVGAPLSATDAATVKALEDRIAAATGAEQARLRRELANLLIGLGQPVRAGEVEEALATAANTADAWRRAGDRYYEALQMTPEAERTGIAPRVVAAYDRLLALEPGDLDARTRLGWAAQYDATGNPMRAITETNAVLESDSTHLGASYNRGWFLARIGRVEQAVAQFRKVQRLAGADSPLGREAESIIETLNEQQTPVAGPARPPGGAPSGSAAPAGPAPGAARTAPAQ